LKAAWIAILLLGSRPAVGSSLGDIAVVTRDLGQGRVFARASCTLAAPPADVFALLADFDHVADYVTAVDSSHVVGADSAAVLVRQVATSGFVFAYTVRMTLRFRLAPPTMLRFEIVQGDFPIYFGDWTCAALGEQTRLTYTVTCKPPEFVPRPLVRHVMERDLRALMPEIAAELARRRLPR